MPFGQLVVGAPGSGKTTWCLGVARALRLAGRDVAIINLDPANENLPFTCDVDISELVSLDEVQGQLGLGPNGSVLYCMDYLQENLDWLKEKLDPLLQRNAYLLFDCPGQAELAASHNGFRAIARALASTWNVSLTAVNLVDSHLVTSAPKHLAALLATLSSMLHLELPYVTLLSKADLLLRYDDPGSAATAPGATTGGSSPPVGTPECALAPAAEDVDRLTDIDVLAAELGRDESSFGTRFARLSSGLVGVVQDYGLVAMKPVAIDDPRAVAAALGLIDLANGYAYAGLAGRNPYGHADIEPVAGASALSGCTAEDCALPWKGDSREGRACGDIWSGGVEAVGSLEVTQGQAGANVRVGSRASPQVDRHVTRLDLLP